MKRLEEQLQCRLFERGGRGVEPTEAGVLLLGYARRILAANDELVGRMAEPMVKGDASIGAVEGFAVEYLVPALARFGRAFPSVEISVRTGTDAVVRAAFDAGALDICFHASVCANDDEKPVHAEPLVWAAADGSAAIDGAGRGRRLALVVTPDSCPTRKAVIHALEDAGLPFQLAFETGSRGAMLAAISAGIGVGVLPKSSLQPGMRQLGSAEGLPPVGDLAVQMQVRDGAGVAAARLGQFLRGVLGGRF
jgi:DNA-binding transcriptional LysR family regulator